MAQDQIPEVENPITEVVLLPRWSYLRGGPITEVVLLPRWSYYESGPITKVVLKWGVLYVAIIPSCDILSSSSLCSVVGILDHYYMQFLKSARWIVSDSNWKYLFVVPSRAKLYEMRQKKKRSTSHGGEFDIGGVRVKVIESGEERSLKGSSQASGKHSSSDNPKSHHPHPPPSSDSPSTPPSCSTSSDAVKESDYFAGSQDPRDPRPPHVKFYVGQVVKHVRYGYYGVIVGWDEVAKVTISYTVIVSYVVC